MDINEIRKWHSVFKRPDELFEIRIIGDKNYSGYFYDVEEAIKQLPPFNNNNIYYVINEVKRACASRKQFNCFLRINGSATSKQDIEHRWWLPIDVDCKRPSDVSSTNEEKKKALDKAREIFVFLLANGFPKPVVCDSSSGYHILYPIDIENTQEAEDAIKTFLQSLSHAKTDEFVKIDTVLCDANRIIRLPGTFGRKGRNSDERPHRLARILSVPNETRRMGIDEIIAFNNKFKVKEERIQRKYGGGSQGNFDLRDFIRQYNIGIAKEVSYSDGGTKFVLTECPFDSSHKAPDAALFQMGNGAIGFKCLHDSCSRYDWHSFRKHFDPTAYDTESFQQQPQQYRQPLVPKIPQKPVIKQETPELGKKWQTMKDIKKIDIINIPHFSTGFTEMDKLMKGLFLGEVTILSGSNSSGKSSWLNTLILNVIDQGYKVALWSGELRADVLKSWIQMAAAGRKYLKPTTKGDYWYVPNNIGDKIDSWMSGKFFLYNNEYSSNWTQIFNDMKEMIQRGVKLFCLDNLMSMNIDIVDGDGNQKQKALITQICQFAKQNGIHLILVAHPRKVTTFIRKQDISGTSDLTNAVDNVLIAHRVNKDFLNLGGDFFGKQYIEKFQLYGNVIEIAKNRLMGIQDKLCGMYYEIESRRFKNENEEEMEYGWNAEPVQSKIEYGDTQVQSDQPTEDNPFGPPDPDAQNI